MTKRLLERSRRRKAGEEIEEWAIQEKSEEKFTPATTIILKKDRKNSGIAGVFLLLKIRSVKLLFL